MAAPQAPLMTDPIVPWTMPASDPSSLTTAQLLREIASLNAIFSERLDSVTVRLVAMDKAQSLFHEDLTRVPTSVDKSVGHLKELHEKMFLEKFESIQTQFKERDERVKQTALDTKTAIDAALAAQEKAVSKQNDSNAEATNKAETQFTRLIEQQRLALDGVMKSLNEKIDDVKELVLRGEGRQVGTSSSLGTVFAIIGALGVIVGIALAVMR